MKQTNRRNFLKFGSGALLLAVGAPKALAAVCGATPPQTKGPFYPGEANFVPDNDLTRVPGGTGTARGQAVLVRGRVLDSACRPIPNANVEIWQACESGRYNHSRDPNPAPMDPDFRYWGETFTDADGAYWFKTIIPGAYPAGEGRTRPPHIHFRVACLGYTELVTQMYFKGNGWNDADLILQAIPAHERDSVIVAFAPGAAGLPEGIFDITLRSVRQS